MWKDGSVLLVQSYDTLTHVRDHAAVPDSHDRPHPRGPRPAHCVPPRRGPV